MSYFINTLEDKERRPIQFQPSRVEDVLPSYFRSEYPDLIQFLEKYYDYLDSDGNIGWTIKHIERSQDIDAVDEEFLDFLFGELSPDLRSGRFQDPRETLKNLADFFRTRGTAYSAKAFFRALFGEEIEIEYPKDQLFTVGVSTIGAEGDIIQNGALYQILSILIKSGRGIAEWRDLYKAYVHPAGFFLGSQLIVDTVTNLSINAFGDSAESTANEFTEVVPITIQTPYEQLTGIFRDIGDSDFRINLEETIETYSDSSVTGAFIDKQYDTFAKWTTPNSPTLDDSDIDLSNVIEKIDQNKYDD